MLDPLPLAMRKSAVLSKCGRYRYTLSRDWNPAAPRCVYVMLNPSTADAYNDDPTIRRCIGFAERLGFGGFDVINLFAMRATNPADLKNSVIDPIGAANHDHLSEVCASLRMNSHFRECSSTVICAWGVHGVFMEQDQTMLGWLDGEGVSLLCLGRTKAGRPRHPLMLPYSTALEPFNG